ncbi:MAG TPA: DUF4382 domain-containing protein [Balneolaceae bacterium]|nr:DUF4382 domain-containing protein [Balneolaceae bacterium]
MKFFSHLSLLMLLPLLFVSCDSSDSNTETGTLRVLLTDAPADYESVFIDVQEVRIHRSTDAEMDESGWIDIMNEPQRLDLLSLVNGNVALLGELDLEPGQYNQMRFILGDDNEVVLNGESIPLDTPSAQQSGLKLNIDSEITEGGLFSLLLDFDASRSIVQAGASGKFILKPVIRTVSLEATGSIEGDIIPAEAQPWVYAIANQDTLAGTRADEVGNFLLIGLPSGTYQVSVEPSDNQYQHEVISNVEVVPNATTELDPIIINDNN